MRVRAGFVLAALCLVFGAVGTASAQETKEVRFAPGYGLAYLPLMVMEDRKLLEKHTRAAGLGETKATFMRLTNPAAMNDGILSGQIDFASSGTPSIIAIWARTKGTSNEIKGAASIAAMPMWLNVNRPEIKSIRDFTDKDRIAVTSVKVSIPAILLQMAALKEWGSGNQNRLDRLTVSMSHPEGLAAFLSKRDITAHFTSPPFMYREAEAPGVHRILSSDDVLGGSASFASLYSSSAFRDKNPRTYKQVLAAFDEALEFVKANRKESAEIYLRHSGDKKSTVAEVEAQLKDPNMIFSASPRGVQRYADFMFEIGSIKQKANSWKDIFFSEIHGADGS